MKTIKEISKVVLTQQETITILLTNLEEAHVRIDALSARIDDLKPRDRGPASTRLMTENDARMIVLGEHSKLSHKEAAAKLGLSYSQVYSCRGGYTFKNVTEEKLNSKKVTK